MTKNIKSYKLLLIHNLPARSAGFFMVDFSTKNISPTLIARIKEALQNIKGWGTVEICIQNHEVVQITEKNIIKTNLPNENVKPQLSGN